MAKTTVRKSMRQRTGIRAPLRLSAPRPATVSSSAGNRVAAASAITAITAITVSSSSSARRIRALSVLLLLGTTATAVSSFGTSLPPAVSSPSSVTRERLASLFGRRSVWGRGAPVLAVVRGGADYRYDNDKSKKNLVRHPAASSSSLSMASTTTSTEADASVSISAENLALLSARGRAAVERLVEYDRGDDGFHQKHVYGGWPEPGEQDDGKRRLAEQLADLDASYPGGLVAYLAKAKTLLRESAEGVNPFEEYTATIPAGESLKLDDDDDDTATMSFAKAEALGIEAAADTAFVLVAGGLGERLGYSGIKLSLETDLCTNECYLEGYCRYLLALQDVSGRKTGRSEVRIPLVIMTSGDTDAATRGLLRERDNFGLSPDQISIVKQDKVAALTDSNAGLALEQDDRWTVSTKPHGHGDVHHLLLRDGCIDDWLVKGIRYVAFLQDTNALVINSVVPTLGVSVAKKFDMNSICIPRLAGEAAGAIAKLKHKTDPNKNLVINVEYNQLDPLLRSQGDGAGDVADPNTGYSPFPGNANNLVIALAAYAKTLKGEDEGVVQEFVNPKYQDETRTTFKKPTRLECMMQDIPKLFQKELGGDVNIGFTMFDRWFTFSPAKNSLQAGQADVAAGGTAPGTVSSAESDKYVQNQRKLRWAGADVPCTESSAAGAEDLVSVAGIPVTAGPRIVLSPAFAVTREEIASKISPAGGRVTVSRRSSLVLEGQHLRLENLELDGALIIRTGPDTHLTVDGLKVMNAGWELQELDDDLDMYPEEVRIRGYTMNKKATAEYLLYKPGHFVLNGAGEILPLGDTNEN